MAKRLTDDCVHEGVYEHLTHPPDQDGFFSLPLDICELTNKPGDILVRDSYKKLLRQAMRPNLAFVHLSGNPGTGKSCCIWYFVNALLCNEECRSSYIVVQLVVAEDVAFLIISPEKVVWSTKIAPSAVLRMPGTWLLVDQRFTGKRTTLEGKTILFAGPAQAAAEKTMDELQYATLYLDAWTPSELLKVFNRRYMNGNEPLARIAYDTSQRYPSGSFNCDADGYSAAAHFLARLYVCGGIVRWFFQPLDTVMGRQTRAVVNYLTTGKEEGEGLHGGKPHRVFYSKPAYSLRSIEEIHLVSSYVRKVYDAELFAAGLKAKETFANLAKRDSRFSAAAGDLFEDYAHLFLATEGGTFQDINNANCQVTFRPLQRYVFHGNSLEKFNIPPSASFGIVDSYSPKQGLLLQMSRAKSQSLMDKDRFDALVAICRGEMERQPGDVVINGVPVDEPVFVHVRPHDSKGASPLGLREPVLDSNGQPVVTAKGNQSWRRAPVGIPQLTIALPPMSGDGVKKLSPVYEHGSDALLKKTEDFLLKGQPLFDEQGGDICGECGGQSDVDNDWRVCSNCKCQFHTACGPSSLELCLTCMLSCNFVKKGKESVLVYFSIHSLISCLNLALDCRSPS